MMMTSPQPTMEVSKTGAARSKLASSNSERWLQISGQYATSQLRQPHRGNYSMPRAQDATTHAEQANSEGRADHVEPALLR